DLTFNTTELTVEKNTCVMIMFKNQSNVTHDFTIDGDDDMDKVHLAVMNTTDGHMGVKMFNMMTPDDDTEYEFYCSETGHENMVGTLIVGKGKGLPAPSVIFFIGFLATFAVVKKFKKL
ncbi:MAG: cupredoxin domain-containing protein, partial [Candidatus Heimdallarchaeota archaeon]|nr:cupredoxin domain-containing protein [Candidatus Heimdallarchaeota archaeon]